MAKKTPWHSLNIEEIFSSTDSSYEGLTEVEAQKRLKKFGPNVLPEEAGSSTWRLLLSQFANPLMYIMVAATFVSFYLGKNTEGFFIAIVMISNALVGFYQEHKANLSLKVLKDLVKENVRVIRDNTEREIDASELVRGDIMMLRTGDRVPADGRILQFSILKINEASLTGESKAVEKSLGTVPASAETADRTNMVFMGTMVEEGSANVLVLETGPHTQYGDIISLLKNTEEEKTSLQLSVIQLSKFVGVFITLLVTLIALEGYLKGHPFDAIFETSLALFVSAIPEGLLPAITIILVLGMRRILKQKGLVRRLAATETLGSVTVICTDKTGTLTEGKMEAKNIISADGVLSLDKSDLSDLPHSAQSIIYGSAFATDAYIENPEAPIENLIVRGTPTEQALVMMAHKYGVEKHLFSQKNPVIDTLFFSSDRKYSASMRKSGPGAIIYAVGALEKMEHHFVGVASSSGVFGLNHQSYEKLMSKKDEMISAGYRLIACAYREVKDYSGDKNIEQLIAEGLILAGFVIISDPVRADVPRSFKKTREAGIRTVIVTGDHQLTARAVAREIGLEINDHQIIEGRDIEILSDEELGEKVKTILLYARVSPRHKLRIVQAFQKNNEVVAMFGDGVNDAPALKAADIGVAVGTRVAATREVADIVLLDGGFGTIIKAVEQGRIIFSNIRRVFLYLITQDFSQFFIFIMAIFFGLPLPLIATQLLLINLVESGLPDLALTTEQEKDGLMQEPPRGKNESILNRPSKYLLVSVFIISGAIAFAFYLACLSIYQDIERIRTMMMVLLSMESLFLVFSMRSFTKSIFRKDIFSNRLLVYAVLISLVMIVATVYLKPLQKMLHTTPLSGAEWVIILLINIVEITLLDQFKVWIFRAYKPKTKEAVV